MTERRCAECEHFDLRAAGELARHGFGHCPLRSIAKGHTFSAVRPTSCEKFKAAPASIAEKRMAWLREKGTV